MPRRYRYAPTVVNRVDPLYYLPTYSKSFSIRTHLLTYVLHTYTHVQYIHS